MYIYKYIPFRAYLGTLERARFFVFLSCGLDKKKSALLAHDNDGMVASSDLNSEEGINHLQDGG